LKVPPVEFGQAEMLFYFKFHLLLKIAQKSVSAPMYRTQSIELFFYSRHRMGKDKTLTEFLFKNKKPEFQQSHESIM
jgi:hypothetical protein